MEKVVALFLAESKEFYQIVRGVKSVPIMAHEAKKWFMKAIEHDLECCDLSPEVVAILDAFVHHQNWLYVARLIDPKMPEH